MHLCIHLVFINCYVCMDPHLLDKYIVTYLNQSVKIRQTLEPKVLNSNVSLPLTCRVSLVTSWTVSHLGSLTCRMT